MGTLIDQLSSDRIRGARLVIAYTIGILVGVIVALTALLAAGTTP
jgi:hypothetical protein